MGTLQENLFTYVILSQWIILNLRNVADIVKKIKTHIMLNTVYPKILPLMK